MKDQDVQLIRFLHSVVVDEVKRHSTTTHKECLRKLKTPHNDLRNDHSSTGSPPSALRGAHVYYYSPCLTSALIKHFKRLLVVNPLLLQSAALRGVFTICCFTTGLATEVVAMVSVLEELLRNSFFNTGAKNLRVEAVVINANLNTSDLDRKMVENLPHIVDTTKLNFKISFLPTDLAKSLTDDVKEALSRSDLVTMVNLSYIHEKINSLQVIQEITPFIQEGGALFLMDSSGFRLCDTLRRIILSSEHMNEIYGPLTYDIHRLSFLCMKECLRLYSKYYGWRYCALETKYYVCAWYKKASARRNERQTMLSPDSLDMVWQERQKAKVESSERTDWPTAGEEKEEKIRRTHKITTAADRSIKIFSCKENPSVERKTHKWKKEMEEWVIKHTLKSPIFISNSIFVIVVLLYFSFVHLMIA